MLKEIRINEDEVSDVVERIKKLEGQQAQVKKVDEFNALNREISQSERVRHSKEQHLSDLYDRLAQEEDSMKILKEKAESTQESSTALQDEIKESCSKINNEGRVLKAERDKLVPKADPEVFRIYERLLFNKKDRVVVPIENRCCTGCHITLTAQDENLVRKGERIVFCEHCSRINM